MSTSVKAEICQSHDGPARGHFRRLPGLPGRAPRSEGRGHLPRLEDVSPTLLCSRLHGSQRWLGDTGRSGSWLAFGALLLRHLSISPQDDSCPKLLRGTATLSSSLLARVTLIEGRITNTRHMSLIPSGSGHSL